MKSSYWAMSCRQLLEMGQDINARPQPLQISRPSRTEQIHRRDEGCDSCSPGLRNKGKIGRRLQKGPHRLVYWADISEYGAGTGARGGELFECSLVFCCIELCKRSVDFFKCRRGHRDAPHETVIFLGFKAAECSFGEGANFLTGAPGLSMRFLRWPVARRFLSENTTAEGALR